MYTHLMVYTFLSYNNPHCKQTLGTSQDMYINSDVFIVGEEGDAHMLYTQHTLNQSLLHCHDLSLYGWTLLLTYSSLVVRVGFLAP